MDRKSSWDLTLNDGKLFTYNETDKKPMLSREPSQFWKQRKKSSGVRWLELLGKRNCQVGS